MGRAIVATIWALLLLPACVFDGAGLGGQVSGLDQGGDHATIDATTNGEPSRPDQGDGDTMDRDAVVRDAADRDALGDLPVGPDLPGGLWWDTAWSLRRRLTFDNSQGGELVGFPVLVVLDDQRFDYDAGNKDGKDLRFVSADHTQVLPHEIERWEEGGTSYVWVRVSKIGAASTTDHMWIYYGNPPAKAPTTSSAEVWSDGFAGVWHLSDLHDSLGVSDAKEPKDHEPILDDEGQVASAREFDGAARLELPQSPVFDSDVLTVELWVRSSQSWDAPYFPGSAVLISRATQGYNSGDWAIVAGRSDGELGDTGRVIVGIGAGSATSWEPTVTSQSSGLNDDSFHYVAWTHQAGSSALFIDGKLEGTVTDDGKSIIAARAIHIGGDAIHPDGTYLEGTLDEVRISTVARSADWIAAQQASMTDSFIAFGPEETPP